MRSEVDLEEIRPLSCIQDLQLSIGASGYTVITPAMVLSDTFASYLPFRVMVNGENTDTITCESLNTRVTVKVIDTRNGNSCWSNILVEDKLPPVIECFNDTLPCYTDPFSVDYRGYAAATDNCDDDVELKYAFFFNELGCMSNEFVSYTELRWTAEDDQGLTSQCVSRIFFERVSIDSTDFPLDTTLYCTYLDSVDTGMPLIDSLPLDPLCDVFAVFDDDTIPGRCSGEYTIQREWSVTDICAMRTVMDMQIISVIDTVAPQLLCADSVTVSTESSTCTALYIIPPVTVSDECSADDSITTSIEVLGMGVFEEGDTIELDTGTTNVVIISMDDCGNSDTCEQTILVVDDTAPILFCIPDLEIYLDSNGMAEELCVEDFDSINYYFDNCGIDTILIAKMVDFCDSSRNNQFGTCVEFCCEDVGQEVMVIIKVQDLSGNMNFCMINTSVLDTIPPVITSSPPDTSVSCLVDYTDTTNTGGGITVEDNCAEEVTIKITDSLDIDACEEGTLIRTFIACDPSGNADTAVQVITIFNNFTFDTSLIQWALDTCIENCPPDSLPETIGSETTVTGDSCDVVQVTYSDVDITDTTDVCQVIERTWTVRNECGDTVELDSVQIITFKNFRAPILSGPPIDTTIEAGADSCGAFVQLPRLVATECSSGLTITNDCTPTGDSISMFFPVGVKTITFTATDACGNISTYQTIVRVVDLSGPSLTCPPDTTVDCTSPTDTSVLGVPVVSDNCDSLSTNVTVTFSDSTETGSCPQESTIFRTFTATDSSGNSNTCQQIITVQDTAAPRIVCPADVTISCEESAEPDNTGEPTVSDNCDVSLGDVTRMDSIVPGSCSAESTIFRTWEIEDDCGNLAFCVQMITVVDTTAPMIDCPNDITVSCSEDTDPIITGEPVVMDNCDPMPMVLFQDSIMPGMGQTLRTIIRTWITTDECGNDASCTQVITVRDTTAPTIICPPDITVGCDTNLMDLSIFGEPDTSDNCLGITLTRDTIYDLDLCNVGTITRKFFAQDSVGNIDSCTQVITVALTDSLTEIAIIWPDSVVSVDACTGINPDSMQLGRPEIDSSMAACFKISISFEDSIDYECVSGVCSTLVRKWTVIDSCQLDTLGNGIFCFEQEIEVVDTTAPEITGLVMSDTVYLHPDSMCDAWFRIVADAEDCSGIRSIRNNSMFGVDTFRNASGRYPRGLTPVRFIAEDSCCNADTQFVFVYVLDTIPPRITCRDALLRLRGEAGMAEAEICVSMLIETAIDNCDSRLDLRISFDPNDPTDTCRVYNCDSLMGQKSIMRNLTLYISDGSNNTSTCVSKITVEDNLEICSGGLISGQVSNIHGEGIEDAQVSLMNMDLFEMTDIDGDYEFESMESGEPYRLQVTREDDPMNGISTKDVILIIRHLLGMDPFDSPYQYLAADMNASNHVEVGDVVRIRRLILGRQVNLKQVPNWYFVYKDHQFYDDAHPLDEPEAFGYSIDTLRGDMNIGFVGIRPGDVDGSARVSRFRDLETRGREEVKLSLNRKAKDEVILNVRSDEALEGVFLDLTYHEGLTIDKVSAVGDQDLHSDYFWDNNQGRLRILWANPADGQKEISFILKVSGEFNTQEVFELAQDGQGSEAIDRNLNSYDICMNDAEQQPRTDISDQLIVKQNRPNPFSSSTDIRYFVPYDDNVTLQIWDASGRLIHESDHEVGRGWHDIQIEKSLLGESGVYNYRLVGASGSGTHRMLIIE